MSRVMNALIKQREWQKRALTQQIMRGEEERSELDQSIKEKQQNIFRSCSMPAFIRPEVEMARMHYWMNQEQARLDLMAKIDALDQQQAALVSKKVELDTALKRLEKHQSRSQEKKRIAMVLTQQNNSDEWIVQRREME